jgi:hypothetical protein
LLEGEEDSDVWPPHPFQCVPLFSVQCSYERTDVPLAQTDATRHPGSPARAGRRLILAQPPAYPGFDTLYHLAREFLDSRLSPPARLAKSLLAVGTLPRLFIGISLASPCLCCPSAVELVVLVLVQSVPVTLSTQTVRAMSTFAKST